MRDVPKGRENPSLHGSPRSYSPAPMTVLASATGLNIAINLLLVVFVLVCLLMSMIILMQRPKNEGLGAAFGSGATDQLFGAQTTNVLQRGTVYLGSLFFILTITLAVLVTKRDHSTQTFANEKAPEAKQEAPAQPASIVPPANQPLETEVATPPVQAPKPEGTTTPAPAPAPADKPPGDAAPTTPPAEVTPPANQDKPAEPAEPAKPEEPAKPAEGQ